MSCDRDEDDLNLYTYVGNDPLDRTDPSGLCGPLTPLCIWLAVNAEAVTAGTIIAAEVASGVPSPASMTESMAGNVAKAAVTEVKAANIARNAETGARRAEQSLKEVAAANPGKRVQPETYLRDANGKRAVDPQTGEMRRVDAAVIDSKSKTATTVEITGPNVDKTAQATSPLK